MKRYNVIAVFSPDGKSWLMCRRVKEPYKDMYNLVGGKIEPGETGEAAAYRELFEETGISRKEIALELALTSTYHLTGCYLEFWTGRLNAPITLRAEKNPLEWISLEENFFDMSRFAGMGNLGHFLQELRGCGRA